MKPTHRNIMVLILGLVAAIGVCTSLPGADDGDDADDINGVNDANDAEDSDGADGPRTTPAALRAVAALMPNGRIDEIEFERRLIRLYDITVVSEGRVREVTVTADGVILNVEEEIDPAAAPPSVNEGITRLFRDGKVMEIERVEVRGELRAMQLADQRVEYEAEVNVGGKERLVRLSEDGHVIQGDHINRNDRNNRGHHTDDHDDDGDDD